MSKHNSIRAYFRDERIILTITVLLGLAVRLYGINLPLVDSHQVRQAQTAMVARNLYEDKMNILRTRLDFFGNVPGHVIMEFPLMHAITALLYYFFGVHEIIGRLVSVAFSVGAICLMYGLARQFLSAPGFFAALLLYTFSPMNIFFSRTFMPESSMMFFVVGSVYFLLKWLDKHSLFLYLTAIVFAAFTCLVKPTSIPIFAPICMAWFLKYRKKLFLCFKFWVYMLLTMSPAVFWAVYAYYFNTHNPCDTIGFGSNWIYMITARGFINHWFSIKFYTFVGGSIILLILTPLGFMVTLVGILTAGFANRRAILYAWLAAIIVYFYIFSGASSSHIYYHLPLLPPAAIFFGLGIEWLMNNKSIREAFKQKLSIWVTLTLIILVLAGYGIGYYKYFKYMYSKRLPYVLEISEIIKKYQPNARFLVDNGGFLTPVLSYYSHSRAQFFGLGGKVIDALEDARNHGATAFVAMKTRYGNYVQSTRRHKEFWQYLNDTYKPIALTDHYLIYDLRVKKQEAKNE
jgi:4-amino-4-deoxy-L-arabinose transferase-like glycosyltransferase